MTIKLITFGCRLNIYESEVIKTFLEKNNNLKNKNIIIFNTCTVTESAEKQLRQAIRRERKKNKTAIIGVIGCAVQANENTYKKMEEVDFTIGNYEKMNEKNYQFLENYTKKINIITDIQNKKDIIQYLIPKFENKTRGFVQIQNGCNNHCTFCATRLVRGPSISVEPNKIINQINLLIENGYNEIALTGINISSYGFDLSQNINLGKLLKQIFVETNIQRLQLSSLDIADINDDLKEILYNETKFLPHIHLSLQSGDNEILKKMARRHTTQEAIKFCDEIRKYRKNISIGADIIAGFPTETDFNHQNTLEFIKTINLTFGHIFPYSIRKNTPASLMPQLPIATRRQRALELRELVKIQLSNFIKEQSKYNHNVLIESEKVGRTENYLFVKLNKKLLKNHNIGDIIELKSSDLVFNY